MTIYLYGVSFSPDNPICCVIQYSVSIWYGDGYAPKDTTSLRHKNINWTAEDIVATFVYLFDEILWRI